MHIEIKIQAPTMNFNCNAQTFLSQNTYAHNQVTPDRLFCFVPHTRKRGDYAMFKTLLGA